MEKYQHFMAITNNNRAGRTQRHNDVTKRAYETIALMIEAGILVGPQKPRLQQIANGEKEKLQTSESTFFLMKELKLDTDQKQSRATFTRASGTILSKGMSGLVYNTGDIKLQLSKRTEMETVIRVGRHVSEIYANRDLLGSRDNIVLCSDDAIAVELLQPQKKAKNIVTIGDAVWDKTITGAGFRYIPRNADGVMSLRHITFLTREAFLRIAFTPDEMAAAKQAGKGEAIIKGLICYEYLSCNVSKLAYIKRTHEDLSKVGLICWEGQYNFITSFLGESKLNARVVKRENIDNILLPRKETR